MPRRLVVWVIAAAVVASGVVALLTGPETPPALRRGSVAPAFQLARLDGGNPIALGELRGKVVLLNFWATWCKPCEDEMPAMERLYRALASEGLELLAVSVDVSREPVAAFRDRLGLSFPILLDPKRTVARAYQTFRFPESFLVGRDGVVIEHYIGPKEWDAPAYVARIRRLLEGRDA